MIDQLLEESYKSHSLPFRLERYEGLNAILVFESLNEADRQEILWPIKKLPDDLRLGQKIWLQLSSKASRQGEKDEILKKLLEEMLN